MGEIMTTIRIYGPDTRRLLDHLPTQRVVQSRQAHEVEFEDGMHLALLSTRLHEIMFWGDGESAHDTLIRISKLLACDVWFYHYCSRGIDYSSEWYCSRGEMLYSANQGMVPFTCMIGGRVLDSSEGDATAIFEQLFALKSNIYNQRPKNGAMPSPGHHDILRDMRLELEYRTEHDDWSGVCEDLLPEQYDFSRLERSAMIEPSWHLTRQDIIAFQEAARELSHHPLYRPAPCRDEDTTEHDLLFIPHDYTIDEDTYPEGDASVLDPPHPLDT